MRIQGIPFEDLYEKPPKAASLRAHLQRSASTPVDAAEPSDHEVARLTHINSAPPEIVSPSTAFSAGEAAPLLEEPEDAEGAESPEKKFVPIEEKPTGNVGIIVSPEPVASSSFGVASATDIDSVKASLQATKEALGPSPAKFDSRVGMVVPSSPRGIPVWSLPIHGMRSKMKRTAMLPSPTMSESEHSEEDDSEDENALDVLFLDDGSRNLAFKSQVGSRSKHERDKQAIAFLQRVPKEPPARTFRQPMDRAIP